MQQASKKNLAQVFFDRMFTAFTFSTLVENRCTNHQNWISVHFVAAIICVGAYNLWFCQCGMPTTRIVAVCSQSLQTPSRQECYVLRFVMKCVDAFVSLAMSKRIPVVFFVRIVSTLITA